MTQDETKFWDRLVMAVDRRRVPDEITMAEAERRLAEAEPIPLHPNYVEAIVRSATWGDRGRRFARSGSAPALSRVGAVALGSIVLLSAGVATVAVLWPGNRDSLTTMDYASAVRILGNPAQSDSRRLSAQGKVFFHVQYALRTLREVREMEPALSAAASAHLDRLREVFDHPRSANLVPVPFDESTEDFRELMAIARDRTRSLAPRRATLDVLADRALTGIITLCIATTDHGELRRALDLSIERLLREFPV